MDKNRIFYRINYQIRVPQIRLIDFDGTQVGIVPLDVAQKKAQERRMDLVEIVPQSHPPVCKIMEYSKFKYDQSKKIKDSRKKHKGGQLKEIRFRPHIGDHDLEVKLKHAREFLTENNKVRMTIIFMGREMTHLELGGLLFDKIKSKLSDVAEVPHRPSMLGNRMIFILEPLKKQVKGEGLRNT